MADEESVLTLLQIKLWGTGLEGEVRSGVEG